MTRAPLQENEHQRGASQKPRVTMAKQVYGEEWANQPNRSRKASARRMPIAREGTYNPYEGRAPVPYQMQGGQQEAPPGPEQTPKARVMDGRGKKKKRFSFAALLVSIVALAGIALCGYLLVPMVVRGESAPYAFANGFLLERNDNKVKEFEYYQQYTVPYLKGNTIFPGVYIDNNHMGGKTIEEARGLLNDNASLSAESFKVTVNIGNGSWPIDSSRVALERNIEQVIQKAYAYGRQNTPSTLANGQTPYEQRMQNAIALRGENGYALLQTEVTYDKNEVRALTDAIVNYVNRPAQDSQVLNFDFVRKSFSFSDEATGAMVDGEKLYNDVIAKLDRREPGAVLTYEPAAVLPSVTKLQLMNEYKLIATYTTKTTSNANRNTNVRLSAEAINGYEVKPGETFSFNQTTGQRTEAKGYKEAIAISGGQSVPDVGGGVCQTSGTLFNAVARADLEIVYRSPHAWPSTYVEKGMDATVNWPNLDFKFRNNKDTSVYIVSYYVDRLITVEIYGKSLGNGVHVDLESEVTKTIKPPSGIKYVQNTNLPVGTSKDTIEARTGYEVNTYKIWYMNNIEVKRELFCTSSYRMYQKTVEYN